MSLQTRLTALAQAVGADIKALQSSAAVYRNARGASTAIQNVTASTWVTMDPRIAGQAVIEPVGAFVENADKTITVKDAGWYALSAVVSTNTNYDGVISLMLVGTGEVTLATGTGRGNAGRGAWAVVATEAVKLAAGEIVSLRAIADAIGAVNLQVAHFSIARVGGPQGPKGDLGGTMDAAVGKQTANGATVDIAGAWRALPIGAMLVEPSDAFTVAANAVTVKEAGWYHVSATSLSGQANSVSHFLSLSTLAAGGDGDIANSSGSTIYTRASASGSVKLAAGAKVYVYAWSNAASPVNVYLQSFAIERIGGPQGAKGDPGGVNVVTTPDWDLALTPNFYRSVYDSTGLSAKTIHGPGDTVNPPQQAGIVAASQSGGVVQRVWDLSTGVAYTRLSIYGGGWTAWVADLSKPPIVQGVMAGSGGPGPKEGDERYLQTAAMKTLGIMWKFRYDATPPAGKPNWVFVGGSPWFKNVGVGVGANAGQVVPWGDISFALPVSGDYMVEVGARLYNNGSPYYGNASAYLQQFRGGGAAIANILIVDNWTAVSPGNAFSATPSLSQSARVDNLQEADVLQGAIGATVASALADARWARITPIRVVM